MPTWHTNPQAVAILCRITPDDLRVVTKHDNMGNLCLVLAAANEDTGDLLERLHAKRHLILTEEFGMDLAGARNAGRLGAYIEFFRSAPDVEDALAERFGNPQQFIGHGVDLADGYWRTQANAALVGSMAA